MNIYDLAREAGVSIATASKALNGRKDVNDDTRMRVLEVAKRINYHPSHLARGLARRRSENIGVVALRRFHQPFLTNPFYSRVIEGMETEVTARNYNLLVSVLPAEEAGTEFSLPKMVREKNVDGLILIGETSDILMSEVLERRIPAVVVDTFNPRFEAHYILTENRKGVKLSVEHLLGLGHKRLAFVNSSRGDFSYQERLAGFHEACQGKAVEALTITLDPSPDAPTHDIEAFLKSPKAPTGIVACNDLHAMAVMRIASKLGLDVPRQLSVVGFDDIDGAQWNHPSLTTIRIDKVGMGVTAVKKVFSLLDPPYQKGSRTEIGVELVVRESSGPAA